MRRKIFIAFTAFLVLFGCTNNEETFNEEEILARVGQEVITADEFRLNYEFGFNHLMRSEERKTEYLMHMVNELLLAQEGYRLKLDTLSNIQKSVQNIKEERVIEKVFENHVLSKIELNDEEIIEEANRSAVTFEYKFIPAQNEVHAKFLKRQAEFTSFDETLADYIEEFYTNRVDPEQFQSSEMEVYDVDPEIFDAIKNLDLNQPSNPVFIDQRWYIFAVSNISRTPISPNDYSSKKHSARKILYNRKAVELAETFVSGMMESKNVVTKRDVFDPVNEALMRYYERELPNTYMWDVIEKNHQVDPDLNMLYQMKDDILVEFDGTYWTVKDFFRHFNAGRYTLRPDGYEVFTARFSDLIAITVRDKYLFELAEKDGAEEDFDVQRDVIKWEQKWVFQEMRKRIFDDVKFTRRDVEEFYMNHKDLYSKAYDELHFEELPDQIQRQFHRDYLNQQLMSYADGLRQDFPVEINFELLDNMEIHQSKSNPNMTVALFKQNSNRLAFPIVDPQW